MQKLKKPHSKRWFAFMALGLIIVAAIVVVLLEATNTTHIFHKATLTVSTIASTHPTSTTAPSNPQKRAQPNTSSSSTSNQTDKSTAPVPPANGSTAPIKPTGTFISNHSPNLSGKPNPTQENSVCVTTPGATCYIEFTQGGVVNKLDAETTDSNGAAYWTWDVSQDGFTTGTWQVTIVATLNGKTATSTDTMEVQP